MPEADQDNNSHLAMKTFKELVLAIIKAIPRGKVMSYGQIAAYAGSPRAARQVGQILRNTDGDSKLPWWRVINSQGVITIKGNWYSNAELQKKLLEREHIKVSQDFIVPMATFRWTPSSTQLEQIIA